MEHEIKDAENDPIYQDLKGYEETIEGAPQRIQQLFREMPLNRQLVFMESNPIGTTDFKVDDRVIIEQLDEPFGKGSKGGQIKVMLDGDEIAVSYSNDLGVDIEKSYEDQDDADVYFAQLVKKYPECKGVKI